MLNKKIMPTQPFIRIYSSPGVLYILRWMFMMIFLVLCLSCKKTIPGNSDSGGDSNSDTTGRICNGQLPCPAGFSCVNGHCKANPKFCTCTRPVPVQCAAFCGP